MFSKRNRKLSLGFKGINDLAIETKQPPLIPERDSTINGNSNPISNSYTYSTNTHDNNKFDEEVKTVGDPFGIGCSIVIIIFLIGMISNCNKENSKSSKPLDRKPISNPSSSYSYKKNSYSSNQYNSWNNTNSTYSSSKKSNNGNYSYNKYNNNTNSINTPTVKNNNSYNNLTRKKTTSYYSKDCIRFVQNMLLYFDFKIGQADGIMGPKTKAAIQEFREITKIGKNSNIDKELLLCLVGLYLYKNYGSIENTPEKEKERFYKKLESFGVSAED